MKMLAFSNKLFNPPIKGKKRKISTLKFRSQSLGLRDCLCEIGMIITCLGLIYFRNFQTSILLDIIH